MGLFGSKNKYTEAEAHPEVNPEVKMGVKPEVEAKADDPNKHKDFYFVKLDPPYEFEGEKHVEIDLSGLKTLTGRALKNADMEFLESGQRALAKEFSSGYAFILAGIATKKPASFFEDLPIHSANEVCAIVQGFLLDVVSVVEAARNKN